MDKILLKYVTNFSVALGGVYYLFHFGEAVKFKKENFKKGEILSEEFNNKLVEIISKTQLSTKDKLRLEFKKDSFLKNIDITNTGSISSFSKVFNLPVYYTYKNEDDLKPFFNYLKKRYSSKFANVDLYEYKNLFLLEPKELEFAILLESHKLKYDYALMDAMFLSILPTGLTNFFFLTLKNIKPEFSLIVSMALFLSSIIVYFKKKENLMEYFCIKDIFKLKDKELMKSGITYFEKKNNQKLLLRDKKSEEIELLINLIKKMLDEESENDVKEI